MCGQNSTVLDELEGFASLSMGKEPQVRTKDQLRVISNCRYKGICCQLHGYNAHMV